MSIPSLLIDIYILIRVGITLIAVWCRFLFCCAFWSLFIASSMYRKHISTLLYTLKSCIEIWADTLSGRCTTVELPAGIGIVNNAHPCSTLDVTMYQSYAFYKLTNSSFDSFTMFPV